MDLDDLMQEIKEPKVGSEDSAWATLKAQFQERHCHIQRFEDKMSTGIPDANICYKGKEFWFEGKFIRVLPKRAKSLVRVGLSADQCNWLKTRSDMGARCFVWVREARLWRLISKDFDRVRDGVPLNEWYNFGMRYDTSNELVNDLLNKL